MAKMPHTMNYPRRRAPIACNFCRQRKRKCDGRKPACSLCSAAGISCDYQDMPHGHHPANHSSPRRQQSENTDTNDTNNSSGGGEATAVADIQRMLGQLESLVRWGSNLLEQQQQTPSSNLKDQRPLPAPPTTPSTRRGARRNNPQRATRTVTASASPSAGINDDNNGTSNVTNTDVADTEDAEHDEDDGMAINFGDAGDVGDVGGQDHDNTLNTSTSVDTPGLFTASLPSLPPITAIPTISSIPTYLFGGHDHESTVVSAPINQTQSLPVHPSNTSCSPEMMDHDATNDNGKKDDDDEKEDAEDEGEPLTIPVGHLTPTGSLFALEPIQKLIGEYPEDYFFQIEGLRNYRPGHRRARGPTGNSLRDDLDGLFLSKAYTDLLLAAFFTHVQPHFPIVYADAFVPFVDRVLGLAWMDDPTQNQDDAEIDVALCLTVLALGRLVYRQDGRHDSHIASSISPGSNSNTAAGTSRSADGGSNAADAGLTEDSTEDSEAYFDIAYGILMRHWATCFKPSVTFASALVYAAIYLCYLDRPLPAWSLVHMASIKLQVIVVQLKGQPVTREETDQVVRLCWTCFLLECDSLAEFHLPRSGMELIIESMPFPSFAHSGSGDEGPNSGRSGLMFLALCSVRRLLNRVHKTVYDANYKARSSTRNRTPRSKADVSNMTMPVSLWTPSSPADATVDNIFNAINMNAIRSPSVSVSIPTSVPRPSSSSPASSTTLSAIGSLKAVSTELISQLDTWFESLPPSIKPDLTHHRPQCLQEGWLRLRYWSAKHIICRPCLVFAALYTGEPAALPDYVLWFSQTCIESCRQYIQTVDYMLVERTQYMWMTRQSLLACAFVITIAARSPLLRFLVAHDASTLIRQALVSTQRWSSPGSTAESIGWILNMILQKERMTGGGMMGSIKGA